MSYECRKCYHETACEAWGNGFLMGDDKYCDCFVDKDSVAPVLHGRWKHLGGDEFYCTNCGFVATTEGSWENPYFKHCPHCGAKMDNK